MLILRLAILSLPDAFGCMEFRFILIQPLVSHSITIECHRKSTAVRLAAVPNSTKYTCSLCTAFRQGRERRERHTRDELTHIERRLSAKPKH